MKTKFSAKITFTDWFLGLCNFTVGISIKDVDVFLLPFHFNAAEKV